MSEMGYPAGCGKCAELQAEVERLQGYMTPGQVEEHGIAMAEYRKRLTAEAEAKEWRDVAYTEMAGRRMAEAAIGAARAALEAKP